MFFLVSIMIIIFALIVMTPRCGDGKQNVCFAHRISHVVVEKSRWCEGHPMESGHCNYCSVLSVGHV